MYLDHMKQRDPSIRITSRSFQRLLLVAVMEAAKFFDDDYYNNKRWAQIGGISTSELNELELTFLFRIRFRLNISRDDYDEFVKQLHKAHTMSFPHGRSFEGPSSTSAVVSPSQPASPASALSSQSTVVASTKSTKATAPITHMHSASVHSAPKLRSSFCARSDNSLGADDRSRRGASRHGKRDSDASSDIDRLQRAAKQTQDKTDPSATSARLSKTQRNAPDTVAADLSSRRSHGSFREDASHRLQHPSYGHASFSGCSASEASTTSRRSSTSTEDVASARRRRVFERFKSASFDDAAVVKQHANDSFGGSLGRMPAGRGSSPLAQSMNAAKKGTLWFKSKHMSRSMHM
jgi:hypothetical protein